LQEIRIRREVLMFFLLKICLFSNSYSQLKFHKQLIASESYETVSVFDVNNDNNLDIISGDFWYEGPDFLNRHFLGVTERSGPNGEYWNQFGIIPIDVNGDEYTDFVSGDWFSKSIWWCENPGNNGRWKKHFIDSTGNVEVVLGADIDGDGTLEIIPNTPNDSLKYYRLKAGGNGETGTFIKVVIGKRQGHGLGVGDLNGDGKNDFVTSEGWYEAPKRPGEKWTFHEFFDKQHKAFTLGDASVPILVEDINGDGNNDLILGHGHGYGLWWYEQISDHKDGKENMVWIKHPIDPFSSQYHTMQWTDIDNDGKDELITGKRYRAHNGRDPGSNDPIGLYYFKWNGESFTKGIIDYGKPGVGKGAGLVFFIADLHNSGRKDIVVAGKDGLYVFYNIGTDDKN